MNPYYVESFNFDGRVFRIRIRESDSSVVRIYEVTPDALVGKQTMLVGEENLPEQFIKEEAA